MASDSANFDKLLKRQSRFFRLLGPIILPFCLKKIDLTFDETPLPEGANLILANHTTSLDQWFIIRAFYNRAISFVASEDAFRNKLLRRIVEWCFDVIVHMRGKDELRTTREMIGRLKAGASVMVFPEGTTTFDGRTRAIDKAIAKMARIGGGNLVLVQIQGGYLAKPRWAKERRRGRIHLTKKILTPEQIKAMSVDQLHKEINKTLYLDEYERQKTNPASYRAEEPAIGLESALYRCPKCSSMRRTLRTEARRIFCECGFMADYDDQGYLTDTEGTKHTVGEFVRSQREVLKEKIKTAEESGCHELLFEEEFDYFKFAANGKRDKKTRAFIQVFTDHFDYETPEKSGSYPLSDLRTMYIFRRNRLILFINGIEKGFECFGDFSMNALKYRDLYEIVSGIEYAKNSD